MQAKIVNDIYINEHEFKETVLELIKQDVIKQMYLL